MRNSTKADFSIIIFSLFFSIWSLGFCETERRHIFSFIIFYLDKLYTHKAIQTDGWGFNFQKCLISLFSLVFIFFFCFISMPWFSAICYSLSEARSVLGFLSLSLRWYVVIWCDLATRPIRSQFRRREIRRSTFPNYIKFVDRRIWSFQNCDRVVGQAGPDLVFISSSLFSHFLSISRPTFHISSPPPTLVPLKSAVHCSPFIPCQPDEPFHNVWASKSVDRLILCCSVTSCYGF